MADKISVTTAKTMADSPQVLARLGLGPATDELFNRRFVTTGLIDCLPIATIDQTRLVVFRAGVDSDNALPGVAVADFVAGESMLIASEIINFIPIWVVTRLVNTSATEWDVWKCLDEAEWQSLVALYRQLGGHDDLQPLQDLLNDVELKAALCRDMDGELWSTRLPDAFEIAAPSDGRGRFQKTLAKVFEQGWLHDLDFSTFARWRPPLETALGVFGDPPDQADLLNLLLAASRRPSSHDASWSRLVGVGEFSGTAARETGAPILTARALAQNAPAGWRGPLSAAVQSLATAGSAYNGRAHLELIASLKTEEDHIGAWQAALTAGFWIYHRYGKVPAEVQLLYGRLSREVSSESVWQVVARNLSTMGVEI